MGKVPFFELPVQAIPTESDFPFGGSVLINAEKIESINLYWRGGWDSDPALSVVMQSGREYMIAMTVEELGEKLIGLGLLG